MNGNFNKVWKYTCYVALSLVFIVPCEAQTRHGGTVGKAATRKTRATSRSTNPAVRQSGQTNADGILYINRDNEVLGMSSVIQPYTCSFKKNLNTKRGPVTVDYSYKIDWPLQVCYNDKDLLRYIREVINYRILDWHKETLSEVVAGIDMSSDIIYWLKSRTSSLWDRTDSVGNFSGAVKNNLKISLVPSDDYVKIIVTESSTYANGKTFSSTNRGRVGKSIKYLKPLYSETDAPPVNVKEYVGILGNSTCLLSIPSDLQNSNDAYYQYISLLGSSRKHELKVSEWDGCKLVLKEYSDNNEEVGRFTLGSSLGDVWDGKFQALKNKTSEHVEFISRVY